MRSWKGLNTVQALFGSNEHICVLSALLSVTNPKHCTIQTKLYLSQNQYIWVTDVSIVAVTLSYSSFCNTVSSDNFFDQPLHPKSSNLYPELPVHFFLYRIIVIFTHDISPLPLISLSIYAAQFAHSLLICSATFSHFFPLSLLHSLHPSILTFQVSDLSHYISVLPAKS